jgi:hypothetical protein
MRNRKQTDNTTTKRKKDRQTDNDIPNTTHQTND